MSNKSMMGGCIIAASVVILVMVVGGLVLYDKVAKPMLSLGVFDSEVGAPPGIVVGEDVLTKTPFTVDASLSDVTEIRHTKLLTGHENAIALVSSTAVVFVDAAGKTISTVKLAGRANNVNMIPLTTTGDYGFINRGSWGSDAALLDAAGKELWTYGGSPGVDDMCSGDLDGDGKAEFAVGFNGDGGIHLLDAGGKKLWQQPGGNIWHVEIADTTGKGTMQIVHSDAAGSLTVRDATGAVVRNVSPGPYFSQFSLCSWPTSTDRQYVLMAESDAVWLFDFDGTKIVKYDAPGSGSLGDARGITVKLAATEGTYLAVVVNFRNTKSAVFYLYDAGGKLVYQERHAESCTAIATLPDSTGATESILLGGNGTVWSYRLNP